MLDQCRHFYAVAGVVRATHADAKMQYVSAYIDRVVDRLHYRLNNSLDNRLRFHFLKHHHKLIAAYASNGVFQANRGLQTASDFLQYLVANGVTQFIVDRRETIQNHAQDIDTGVITWKVERRTRRALFEAAQVGQPRQWIMHLKVQQQRTTEAALLQKVENVLIALMHTDVLLHQVSQVLRIPQQLILIEVVLHV